MLIKRLRRRIFRQFYEKKLVEMVAPKYPIVLDYPIKTAYRYGYGKPPHTQLLALLESGRPEYARRLSRFSLLKESLTHIAQAPTSVLHEPYWGQDWFTTLDAVALYGMLVEFRPRTLVEIGSGHSTRFARRAIRDYSLPTRIISIDPAPRVEIDQLCDSVIRLPLEEVDPSIFDELGAGDFLFVDSSHRTFTNSDVTVAFMDILPRLHAGVVVHFHDILWPRDYPSEWADRYYSEQYLLGAYLLGDAASRIEILLPNGFVAQDARLAEICKPLIEIPGIRWSKDPSSWPYDIAGGSFWLRHRSETKVRNEQGVSGADTPS
jgi:hypothetical protein